MLSTVVPVYLHGESLHAKQAGHGKPLPPADPPGSAQIARVLEFGCCQETWIEMEREGSSTDKLKTEKKELACKRNCFSGAVPYQSVSPTLLRNKIATTFDLHTHVAISQEPKSSCPFGQSTPVSYSPHHSLLLPNPQAMSVAIKSISLLCYCLSYSPKIVILPNPWHTKI